jgi:Uma2 family endonuclease
MTAHAIAPATLADLERHPGRCELIDGEIIDMAPSGFDQGFVSVNISVLLSTWARSMPGSSVRVLSNDPGFILGPATVRAPDVAVITSAQAAQAPARGFIPSVPLVAVEIVSPGDAWSDVKAKARMWLDHGVRLVWVVDPRSQTVEIYRPGTHAVEFGPDDRLDGGEVLPGFSCAVADCFR